MAAVKYTPFRTGETTINISGDVPYITFRAFEEAKELVCVFSTRKGGVSSGMFASMNLGRMEMDGRDNVVKNYEIFAEAAGINPENIIISDQQHTDNIMIVSKKDRGKGLYREKTYSAVDGFITNERETALCLLFADCVPVFLYDPVKKAIGLVHSGWKGTAKEISKKAVRMLEKNYKSNPSDIISVIAPSICRNCYEVSGDLYDAFCAKFSPKELAQIFFPKDNGKFQLDLWQANRIILKKAGLTDENIHITDLCTCCNSSLLFSHRASKGKRGNLAGIIMLTQEA